MIANMHVANDDMLTPPISHLANFVASLLSLWLPEIYLATYLNLGLSML